MLGDEAPQLSRGFNRSPLSVLNGLHWAFIRRIACGHDRLKSGPDDDAFLLRTFWQL